MQAQMESRGIALPFLTLAPHPNCFTHVKKPQYHCVEVWVGASAGLDEHGK